MTDRYLLAVLDVLSIGGGILLFAGGGAGVALLLGPQDVDALLVAVQVEDLLELVLEPEVPHGVIPALGLLLVLILKAHVLLLAGQERLDSSNLLALLRDTAALRQGCQIIADFHLTYSSRIN